MWRSYSTFTMHTNVNVVICVGYYNNMLPIDYVCIAFHPQLETSQEDANEMSNVNAKCVPSKHVNEEQRNSK